MIELLNELLSVSQAAERIGARPKDISDLFYIRKLSGKICPIVAGRRIIPENYLDTIKEILKQNGRPVGENESVNVAN